MIYIHGGALIMGSAYDYEPKGAVRNFVSRGVIIVTIQYRLGLLELHGIQSGQQNLSTYNNAYLSSSFSQDFSLYLGPNLDEVYNKIIKDAYTRRNITPDDHVAWLKAWSDVFTAAYSAATTFKDIDNWLWINNTQVYLYEFTYSTKIGFPYPLPYPIPGWERNPKLCFYTTRFEIKIKRYKIKLNIIMQFNHFIDIIFC
uniref:Carboxylesterase type B domain-containing protein n=1 Tax=Acrobeloides nanus TaxID=290746 RepID=A0A914CEA2_9BILA